MRAKRPVQETVTRAEVMAALDPNPVPRPYYVTPDGAITVYCARWEAVVVAGLVPVREVALVHADPTYGNGDDAHRPGREEGRRVPTRTGVQVAKGRAWKPLDGNDKPYDPAPLLALDRPSVLWGGDHYSSRLPDMSTEPCVSWLVWDKRNETVADNGSDCELAWSNFGGARRTFRHAWRGLARASETGTSHLHPTQKPIALCSWVYARAKLKRGDLVFVPYMGSGPDLAACVAAGLRCIACEVEEEYCRVAVGARLHAAPKIEATLPGGLFK